MFALVLTERGICLNDNAHFLLVACNHYLRATCRDSRGLTQDRGCISNRLQVERLLRLLLRHNDFDIIFKFEFKIAVSPTK